MKIHIYTIHKNEMLVAMAQHYSQLCKGFGVEILFFNLLNKHIQEAQKRDSKTAKQSYTKAFEQYLDSQSILLDACGTLHDSMAFSRMVNSYSMRGNIVKFFIAGAFGFEASILQKYPKISLSTLTFSHEIAKIVLLEQIYRSLSIIHNHPYHKL